MLVQSEFEINGRKVQRIGGADLCDLLGISPAALTDLKKRGIAVHLAHDSYDMAETVRSYTAHLRGVASARGGHEHVANLSAERARLAKEKADEAARKNALAAGELVRAAEVLREWSEILRKVRSAMLAVPARIRPRLPHLDAAEIAIIDRELRSALEGLAHGND